MKSFLVIFIAAIFIVGCKNPLGSGDSLVDTSYDAGVPGDPGNTPPTSLTASAADSEVSLSWTAVAGATSYNILRGPTVGSLVQIATSATNTYQDTTAVNGTVYYYSIQSVGSGGTSANSSNLQVAPLSVPTISSANVSDAGGANALVVTWSASTGAGAYSVQYSTTSGSASTGVTGCSATAPTVTCTITGLTAGTTYYLSVQATNSYFGVVDSAELAGIPRSLPTLSLTPLSQQITPAFSATGAASYNLSYGTSTGSYSTTITGATSGNAVTGLINGTNYFFRVAAIFANGSLSSTESSSSPTGPQTFSISSATAGHTQVALSWGASTGATSYTVRYGTSTGSYPTTFATGVVGTTSTVTGLTNGTTYYFMVTAVNAAGSLNATAEASAAPNGPQAFSITTATAGHTQVALSWGASTGATSYTVRYGTSSGSYPTTFATGVVGTTSTVTGLTNGTTYYFMVTAVNAAGSLNATAEVSAAPNGPQAFSITTATASSRQVALVWGASAGATSYTIRYGTSTGSYPTTFATGFVGTTITVTGLTNGTTYYFMVTAVNAAGSLNATAEVSAAPNGPQAFSISTATEGNTQVALAWGASTGAVTYNVSYGTSSGSYPTTFATGVVGTTSTVTGLTNGTTYYFMVTAVNAAGTQDALVEFVRTPALPTLSNVLDITTPTMASNWSATVPFTLGGLGTFVCNSTVAATSSNTAFIANGALTLSGTYPNCSLDVAVGGGLTGTTTITLTATYGSTSATDTFVLTVLPASSATFSVRKLVQGYTGNAIRVRRSSDSTEQNIGFLANGELNTTALSTFCGANSCFVRTWYDQSGNGRDATQTTTTRQPRVVNAGTIDTQNSRVTLIGSASNLTSTFQLGQMVAGTNAATAAFTAAAVFRQSTVGGSAIFATEGSGQRILCHATWSDNITYFDITNPTAGSGRVSGNIGGYSALTQITFLRNGTNQAVFRNGASSISATVSGTVPTTSNTTPLVLFNNNANAMPLTGSISEVTFFRSALGTTDRQALQTSQRNYFGTP
jgi:fibronectin type 3 domain-containing protein